MPATGVLTYAELEEAADEVAAELNARGIGSGDKVGVRVTSGTTDLYVAILGVILAGAAYVPVDVDDPDERARLVFDEADVAAVVGNDRTIVVRREGEPRPAEDPTLDDDAWVIFTSGSTGKPKGVAVTHRNAAAFVDAEARMFLPDAPLGVGDRVMAGLSVAFDASCEEMWLAWRYGGCLVPAPRALVRSGIDVGPWLVANAITVVSTVPTLVALWPTEALAKVRLLIMGGEACPPELVTRLVAPGREVWNTYGPTEATVVACGAELTGDGPVRIGLPLDGWDLAVVDADGNRVAEGETGELIIGGVGLARYLDPAKDAEKYAPMPSLGWDRAYRSGDLVVLDSVGLLFGGRADDQVKLGGRRIELGEIDSALLALPGVLGAAAAVRRTAGGNQLLVGYVTVNDAFDQASAVESLRRSMPAALVPRLALVDSMPTRTSGKVDRDALPWPLPREEASSALDGTAAWIAELWLDLLGAQATAVTDDFFDLGGGSLAAAQMVSRLRVRFPEVAVGDVYEQPTVGALATYLDNMTESGPTSDRTVPPTPLKTQTGQVVASLLLRSLAGPRWLVWIGIASHLFATLGGMSWLAQPSWWLLAAGWLAFVSPPGRMLVAAGVARVLLLPVEAGEHPRGGRIHLRLWLAHHVTDELGASGLGGAPWMTWYARLLGARIGRDVDLHSLPPVTGMLHLGRGCSIEPEVDLSGFWVDGDVVHLGQLRVGRRARVGARSMLCPGPTSVRTPRWRRARRSSAPSPRASTGPARRPSRSPPRPAGRGPSGLPTVAPGSRRTASPRCCSPWCRSWAWRRVSRSRCWSPTSPTAYTDVLGLWPWLPLSTVLGLLVLALLVWAIVRVAALAISTGVHPVRSRQALAVWTTMRVLDEARTWLFPLYSSMLTPLWLRAARCPDRRRRRGVHGADGAVADPGQRPGVPRRRHPDRRLRAGRRLAAGRAGQDRQARLRRQLRDGGPRSQGAQGVAGRRAVGGTAAQDRPLGRVVAGQPAGAAASRDPERRQRPHLRARHLGSSWPAPSSSCAAWSR